MLWNINILSHHLERYIYFCTSYFKFLVLFYSIYSRAILYLILLFIKNYKLVLFYQSNFTLLNITLMKRFGVKIVNIKQRYMEVNKKKNISSKLSKRKIVLWEVLKNASLNYFYIWKSPNYTYGNLSFKFFYHHLKRNFILKKGVIVS